MKQKEKRIFKNEHSISELWDNHNKPNVCKFKSPKQKA